MVASEASSYGARNDGEGPSTVASDNSASSNRVMVEQIFPQHDRKTVCLLPESAERLLTSPLRGHCCTANVYTVDLTKKTFSQTSEVELSAFLSEVAPNGNHRVELCCDPRATRNVNSTKSYFRFEFEDEIRKVQLLPLPLSTGLQMQKTADSYTTSQTIGALLVAISKRGGLSIHSVVFSRKSAYDPFHIAEFSKVSRRTVEDTGPCIEVALFLDNTRDESGKACAAPDPVLYTAILPIQAEARSHRIDVLACPLVSQKSPLFRFDARGPTRALKRSLVLTGIGGSKGVSVLTRRVGGRPYCTVAALFDQEIKIINLPALDKWNTQVLKPEDISTVQFSTYEVGSPLTVMPVAVPTQSTQPFAVKFAIFCCSKQSADVSGQGLPSFLTPVPLEVSPSPAAKSGREGPPPQWTANETRNAVLRARRDIMTNVLHTFHGEEAGQKSFGQSAPFNDSSLQTPNRKRLSLDESTVVDENFEVSIPSPDTAILDMSGKWMSRNPSDSMLYPLAGLGFAGQDDSTVMSFRSQDTLFETPQLPQKAPVSNVVESKPSAHLFVVSLAGKAGKGTANTVQTEVHPIPFSFSSSLQAICMKCTVSTLLLAAKAALATELQVLVFPIDHGQLPADCSSFESIQPIHIQKATPGSQVKGLDLEQHSDGRIQVRVLSTMDTKEGYGRLGQDCLSTHRVSIGTVTVCEKKESQEAPAMNPKNETLVLEKLDRIMNALLQFESNVNERLDRMEQKIAENSVRLARVEKGRANRVEV